MGKVAQVSACFLFLLAAFATAQDNPSDPKTGYVYQHQVGIRVGVWGNLGQTPIAADTVGVSRYEADIKDASFYFEGYFAYRFHPAIMGELSVGIVNRGDITVEETFSGITDAYYGNLTVYPIQLRLRWYPLASTSGSVFPYLMGGLSVYHGRHDVQFTTDYWGFFQEPSRTSFSYTLGAGLDIPIASRIALDGAITYMPINFSKELFFIHDYDALTVTVGVKYLFSSMGK